MKNGCAGIIALSLCLGAAAQAQPQYPPTTSAYYYTPEGAGLYVRADMGPSFFQSGQITKFGPFNAPAAGRVDYNTGLDANMAVGWAFDQYVSLDGEVGYDGATINSVQNFNSSDARVYDVPFLANLTLSYPIPHTILVPYVGGGAGGADSIFDAHGFNNGATYLHGSENDVVFAYQAFAGLRFRLNPNLSLGIGYKYFATADTSYSYPPGRFQPGPNMDIGFDGVRTHNVLFTFEWKFW
ncbi:MAG: outer membrane beta-barrel protein [Verrucomicrobiota bacterium]